MIRAQTNRKVPVDCCYKANDTAGYFVRLRETSVVCMRLEEEEEEEDRTLLMLMRDLSVSVINIGGPTAEWWRFLALFIAIFVSLWLSDAGRRNGCVFWDEHSWRIWRGKNVFVSSLVWPVLFLTQVDCRWKTASKWRHNLGLSQRRQFLLIPIKRWKNEANILFNLVEKGTLTIGLLGVLVLAS